MKYAHMEALGRLGLRVRHDTGQRVYAPVSVAPPDA